MDNDEEYSDNDIIVDGDNLEDIYLEIDESEAFQGLENVEDNAASVFKGHDDAVLCVILNKKGNVAISGGMDDKIVVWKVDSAEEICNSSDSHLDSVTHIQLSSSEKLLSSGDISGVVIIWKIKNSPFRLEEVHRIEMCNEIVGMVWIQENLIVCDSLGTVQGWNSNFSSLYIQGMGCACSGMNVLDDKFAFVLYGYQDDDEELKSCAAFGFISLTEQSVKNQKVDHIIDKSEEFGTSLVSKRTQNDSYITAISNGNQILLVHWSQQGQFNTNFVKIDEESIIESMSFSDSVPYLVFCTNNGKIGIIDLTRGVIRSTWFGCSATLTQIKWLPGQTNFITVSSEAQICLWNGRGSDNVPIKTLTGHTNLIWNLDVTADGTKLVTVSEDTTCRTFLL